MSDQLVTVDATNGIVLSAESTTPSVKKCPSCMRLLAHSAFETDGRTHDRLSPTCHACRARGIITRADAKAGETVSAWSLGKNNPAGSAAGKTKVVEEEPKVVEKKPETPQQKVLALIGLIVEALDASEQRMLMRMLSALGERDD